MVGTKLLFFFMVFTIAMAMPPNSDSSRKLKVQKFLKERSKAAVVAPLNERTFRLPNNTEPVSYNIRLSTDIHRGIFGFIGEVTINIIALETTNNITLHSRHTIIERIDLFNPNGTLYQENVRYTYDSALHFLVIPVNRDLEAGQQLSIEISYQGFLQSDLLGFFRSSYFKPGATQETWLAGTQLTTIHARQAFPCYDEPRYRRPILLQIRHHQSYSAISNMPVSELLVDGEYVTTVFEETPPIPTLVLSFTVSDFDFVETTDSDTGVDFRVYARPEAIQLGQADDALRLGTTMFRALHNGFGIPYSLPKSDQIAAPMFSARSIDSWGLITHQESILLQVNNDSAALRLREVRVAHEYSHNYFSNLVAISSWSYVWLNEGFATHYENVLITIVSPEVNSWQIFLMEYFDVAITNDVMGLLPALNLYAESPEEIGAKYSLVQYYKAAIVIRMVGEAIGGSTTFVAGVRNYLESRQMGNASPEDVYAGLQQAYDNDFPGSGLNFTELMSPWFDFEGFPVVTVSRNDQGLILTQEGFRTLHNEVFGIPITYATASHPEFGSTRTELWMTSRQLEISRDTATRPWTDNDWIIVNLRDSSYYLTNYDDTLWDLIINALNNEHEAIHFLNRGTLFADFHRFIAEDFPISLTIFLRMMESFPLEFNTHVWNRAALGLDLAEVRLRSTELHRDYMNFVQNIMIQIYGERSFDDSDAMDLINKWSCLSGVQQCSDDALNVLIEVMSGGTTNFEFDYRCNGLRAANISVWMEFYLNVAYLDLVDDRPNVFTDLLCTENEDILRFYLDQVLFVPNILLPTEREIILASAAVQHETSFYLLVEYIERYSEAISEITSISNLILELASVSNNNIQVSLVQSLLQFATDDTLTEEFLSELMQPNLNFISRNNDALNQWFDVTGK